MLRKLSVHCSVSRSRPRPGLRDLVRAHGARCRRRVHPLARLGVEQPDRHVVRGGASSPNLFVICARPTCRKDPARRRPMTVRLSACSNWIAVRLIVEKEREVGEQIEPVLDRIYVHVEDAGRSERLVPVGATGCSASPAAVRSGRSREAVKSCRRPPRACRNLVGRVPLPL